MQIFRRVDQTTLINNRNVGGNRPKITFDLSKKKKKSTKIKLISKWITLKRPDWYRNLSLRYEEKGNFWNYFLEHNSSSSYTPPHPSPHPLLRLFKKTEPTKGKSSQPNLSVPLNSDFVWRNCRLYCSAISHSIVVDFWIWWLVNIKSHPDSNRQALANQLDWLNSHQVGLTDYNPLESGRINHLNRM